jgi:hypothetical protein
LGSFGSFFVHGLCGVWQKMNIDIQACFDYVQTNAQNLGKAKGEIIRLDAKLKAVKAAVMENSDASSIAMKEATAHKHIDYLQVVNELASATAEECRLGILVKAAFQKIETFRALEFTRRAEIKNIQ